MTTNPGLCGIQYFTNISRAKVADICHNFEDQGAVINGDNPWIVSLNDITFALSWNPEILVLHATVLKKPWNTPCAPIVSYMHSAIDHSRSVSLIVGHDI